MEPEQIKRTANKLLIRFCQKPRKLMLKTII